jgi:N-acetyltransferase
LQKSLRIVPFSLEGTYVRLEPLRREHAAMLWEIARDALEDLFQWVPYRLQSLEDFRRFNRQVLKEQRQGLSLPFATFSRNPRQIAGTTRFMNMDLGNRKAEIGSTWLAPPWQRTRLNT